MGAAGRTLGMGARRRTRMPRTHTARGRAQARAHPNVRCWAPEEGEACAAALGRARTHRANSIRHRPASSRRAASRTPAPRPGQPAAGQTPAPCHGIFSFLDLAMTGLASRWVRGRCRSQVTRPFRPCRLFDQRLKRRLVRGGRRLPVGACARASRLARSLAFPRCVYAVARRAASPFPLCTGRGPAAGVLREWCLVASRACRAVATGTVLCHGAALCAQRSALSAMIKLSAPPMRKRVVARDRSRCEGLGRARQCSRGRPGERTGVWGMACAGI